MLTQVANHAHHVVGDEPPDGAARIDAYDHPARGVEHETGRLDEGRVVVEEGARFLPPALWRLRCAQPGTPARSW